VENVIRWVKARKSDNGGNCIEIAFSADGHALGMVRDSKAVERGHLSVTRDMFTAFVADIKAGRLNALRTYRTTGRADQGGHAAYGAWLSASGRDERGW
jgi:hypothetical protein